MPEATTKFENFEFSSKQLLLNIVNEANSLHLLNTTVEFINPTPIVGAYNTTATLVTTPGGGFIGTHPIRYNRLDFNVLFQAYPVHLEPGNYPTSDTLLPAINQQYGLLLDPTDIIIESVNLVDNRYTLKAKATSLAWIGSTEIRFAVDITATVNFRGTHLEGLVLPAWTDESLSVTLVNNLTGKIRGAMDPTYDIGSHFLIAQKPMTDNVELGALGIIGTNGVTGDRSIIGRIKYQDLANGLGQAAGSSVEIIFLQKDNTKIPKSIVINGKTSDSLVRTAITDSEIIFADGEQSTYVYPSDHGLLVEYNFTSNIGLQAGTPYNLTLSSELIKASDTVDLETDPLKDLVLINKPSNGRHGYFKDAVGGFYGIGLDKEFSWVPPITPDGAVIIVGKITGDTSDLAYSGIPKHFTGPTGINSSPVSNVHIANGNPSVLSFEYVYSGEMPIEDAPFAAVWSTDLARVQQVMSPAEFDGLF